MSLCWKQFEQTDIISRQEEEKLFDKVWTECINKFGIKNKRKLDSSKTEIFLSYLDICHTTNNKNIKLIFDILANYNFNLESEIYYIIAKLAFLKNFAYNKNKLDKLLSSPIIDDISFNNGIFTIYSQSCGNYSFGVASYFFKDNKAVIDYIKQNQNKLEAICHYNTEFLTEQYPNLYAVTTKCLSAFANYRYYHSYAYEKSNDIVIDLCLNAIMNRKDYERLQHPLIVSQIQGKDIDTEFANIDKSFYDLSEINTRLLIIALHKEYMLNQHKNDKPKLLNKVNN